jgi:transcriptional regulator with XRE-family HTH domain
MVPRSLPCISESVVTCKSTLSRDQRNIRISRVALPFCSVTLLAKKPHSEAYPKELSTIGDHLRKRRLDLGMLQRQVAQLMGVDTTTITNWEKGQCQPTLRMLPKLIEFLGYSPFPIESASIGERIKAYRREHGISQKELANLLGVDPGTLARCECGKSPPRGRLWVKLAPYLQRPEDRKADGA